eukprot:COSAG02_NODE_309_length_25051_cov_5.385460_18_plen_444_part_00
MEAVGGGGGGGGGGESAAVGPRTRFHTAEGEVELAETEPEPQLAEPDQQPALAEAELGQQSGQESEPETVLAAEEMPEADAEAEQWQLAAAAASRAHSLFEQEQTLARAEHATATSAVAGAVVLRQLEPEPELPPSADVVQFSLGQVQLIAAAGLANGAEVGGEDAEADELDDTLDDADEASSDEVDEEDAAARHTAEQSAEEQLWAMWQQDVETRAQARTERQAAEALRAHSPTTDAPASSALAALEAEQGGRVSPVTPLSNGLDSRSPFEGWYSCGTLVGLTSEAEPATVPTTCGFLEKHQIVEILEVATTTSGRLRGRTRHGWVSFRERDGKAILLPVSGSVGRGVATPKRKKKRGQKKKKRNSSSEGGTPRVRESGELFGSSTARRKAERQARQLLESQGFDRATFLRIERWITVIEMHREKRISDRYLKLLIHQVRPA